MSDYIEQITLAGINLTHGHHHIHGGESFCADHTTTTASTDNHRTALGFKTPNTARWGHLTIIISASQPAEFFLDEAPIIDDDAGTQKNILNRNRNSSATSVMLSLEGTPVANKVTTFTEAQIAAANYVAGTIIENPQFSGGQGPFSIGGSLRGTQEIILKQNTKYLFILQNVGANANVQYIQSNFYEHENFEVGEKRS